MGKKKRYRGHYCWMCESILSNESFSGRGHRDHICKKCKKLPRAKRQEKMDQDFLFKELVRLGLIFDWGEVSYEDESEYDAEDEWEEQHCLELDTELRFLADQEDLFQLLDIAKHYDIKFSKG